MIRPARPDDLDAVMALGIEALKTDPYPNLVIDREKVRELAVRVISGASHFCWVVEIDGEVKGALSAFVDDAMFYERKQATVLQFYCKAPGWGVKLIRQFLAWARMRRAIKLIVFTLEGGADPRIGLLLKRLGLSNELPVYLETR